MQNILEDKNIVHNDIFCNQASRLNLIHIAGNSPGNNNRNAGNGPEDKNQNPSMTRNIQKRILFNQIILMLNG